MAKSGERDVQSQMAAYLLTRGVESQRIQTMLSVSQPQVSKLLRHAREKGWLREEFVAAAISSDNMRRLRQEVIPERDEAYFKLRASLDALADGFGAARLDEFEILDTSTTEDQSNDPSSVLESLALASQISDQLLRSTNCLVAWGRTLFQVIQGICHFHPARSSQTINFLPARGEPQGLSESRLSPSLLSKTLHQQFNGDTSFSFSLSSVSALVPMDFDPSESLAVRKLLERTPAYKQIYLSGDSSLAKHADTILTSVGDAPREAEPGTWLGQCVETGRIPWSELQPKIAGDISGVFIQKKSLSPGETKIIDEVNESWNGIQLEHVKSCAENARTTKNAPGVIVIAASEVKSEIVIELCRNALVNQLYIDRSLARELQRQLDKLA
jgi:DNA-binding transcriptional regulator LsrR (DeoR family)